MPLAALTASRHAAPRPPCAAHAPAGPQHCPPPPFGTPCPEQVPMTNGVNLALWVCRYLITEQLQQELGETPRQSGRSDSFVIPASCALLWVRWRESLLRWDPPDHLWDLHFCFFNRTFILSISWDWCFLPKNTEKSLFYGKMFLNKNCHLFLVVPYGNTIPLLFFVWVFLRNKKRRKQKKREILHFYFTYL